MMTLTQTCLPPLPATPFRGNPESLMFMKGLELNFGTYSAVDTELRTVVPVPSVGC